MLPQACIRCKSIVIPYLRATCLAVVLCASGGLAHGEDAATWPVCSTEQYRAFDFWLGRWEVQLADGRRAGANRITATDDGCLIEERWLGAGGSRGYSMNFYQPVDEFWRQIWVSGQVIIEIQGNLQDGSMVLMGDIRYRGSGESRPFRGRWTLQDDGRVRQFFEERVDEEWQPWFEGFYSKVVE